MINSIRFNINHLVSIAFKTILIIIFKQLLINE